jgi:2-oxo-4-hydroxy-4-carboxy-5-ureidoimidazoline decarboxylase
VDRIVASRPYATAAELAGHAAELAATWSGVELDTAMAAHPRIGERAIGEDPAADASRREQAGMRGADAETAAAIAVGNAAYERRFGRIFLIRAAGRSPEEILAEVHRRLTLDPSDEQREAITQLAEIAMLRLRSAVALEGTER